jgi:hypothetical protein
MRLTNHIKLSNQLATTVVAANKDGGIKGTYLTNLGILCHNNPVIGAANSG